MLRLAPAERVCAVVEMNNPGVWVLGEVRKHIQAAGMGIVVEYAGSAGEPRGGNRSTLAWDYHQFAAPRFQQPTAATRVTTFLWSSNRNLPGTAPSITGRSTANPILTQKPSLFSKASAIGSSLSIAAPTITPSICIGTALRFAACLETRRRAASSKM